MEVKVLEYRTHNNQRVLPAKPARIVNFVSPSLLYFIAVLVIALLSARIFIEVSENDMSFYARKILYFSSLLLLGGAPIFYPIKRFVNQNKQSMTFAMLHVLLMAALIYLISLLLFYFSHFASPNVALPAACSFLLPAAIAASWHYFKAVLTKTFSPWTPPQLGIVSKKAFFFLNGLQIKIKVKLSYFDSEEALFMLTAPGHLQLGKVFNQFITTIPEKEGLQAMLQLKDAKDRPFAWHFFLQKQFDTIMLNPESTLISNKIKQHSIILVERIITQ